MCTRFIFQFPLAQETLGSPFHVFSQKLLAAAEFCFGFCFLPSTLFRLEASWFFLSPHHGPRTVLEVSNCTICRLTLWGGPTIAQTYRTRAEGTRKLWVPCVRIQIHTHAFWLQVFLTPNWSQHGGYYRIFRTIETAWGLQARLPVSRPTGTPGTVYTSPTPDLRKQGHLSCLSFLSNPGSHGGDGRMASRIHRQSVTWQPTKPNKQHRLDSEWEGLTYLTSSGWGGVREGTVTFAEQHTRSRLSSHTPWRPPGTPGFHGRPWAPHAPWGTRLSLWGVAPRGTHSYGLQGRGPRVTPHLLGNWGSSWPGPELPDWLTLLHCPRRWGLHGGPQEHAAHSLPHRTKGRASGLEDHGGGLVRPLPRSNGPTSQSGGLAGESPQLRVSWLQPQLLDYLDCHQGEEGLLKTLSYSYRLRKPTAWVIRQVLPCAFYR